MITRDPNHLPVSLRETHLRACVVCGHMMTFAGPTVPPILPGHCDACHAERDFRLVTQPSAITDQP